MSAFEAPPFEARHSSRRLSKRRLSTPSPLADAVAPHASRTGSASTFAPEAFASTRSRRRFRGRRLRQQFRDAARSGRRAGQLPADDNFLARRAARPRPPPKPRPSAAEAASAGPAQTTEAPRENQPALCAADPGADLGRLAGRRRRPDAQPARTHASSAPQPQPSPRADVTPRTVVPAPPKAPAPASNSTAGTRLTPAPPSNAGNRRAEDQDRRAQRASIPVPATLALVPSSPPKAVQPAAAPQAAAPKPAPSAPKSAPPVTDKVAAARQCRQSRRRDHHRPANISMARASPADPAQAASG